ncbi:MAG: DUF1499 domain-containing protein, partial [Acidiferrobacterales bacterium]
MSNDPHSPNTPKSYLPQCPKSRNCVCSDAVDPQHHIEPIQLKVNLEQAWATARSVARALSRTTLITVTTDYLHAECRSRVWQFVDDLELQLRPVARMIAVRSASRIGYSDLGVN